MKKNLDYNGLFKPKSNWHKFILTMKITAFLLFCCLVNIFAAPTYSQATKISLNLKDVTIEEVLNKIEDESEFYFLYNQKLIDVTRKVDIEANKEPIGDILTDIFKNNVQFIVYDKQIILTQGDKTTVSTAVQQPKITGIVTNEGGTPLSGVTVLIKGTTLGVFTDASGKYTINNAPENATLSFSFIGMTSQEIPLKGQTNLDVVLKSSTTVLEDVVVVGYGTVKKINATGSVAAINAKDIKALPISNITSGLVGRMPGLISVDRGGIPGSNPLISIRGFANMLVIVDGVENSFNNIDPNEIESVSILKDASASIYGARAGNGVMIITTKRGKSQAPTISFNAYYGVQSPTRISKYVDAPTFARMTNDAEIAAGRPSLYTEEEINKYRNGTDPDYPNTNWYKEVFRPSAPIALYNLNTSGGGEYVSYFLSLGYLDQEGLFRSGDIGFKRINIRSNIDAKITKSFSVSLDLAVRDEFTFQPGGSVSEVVEDLQVCKPTSLAHFPDPTKLTYSGHLATQPIGRSTKDFSGYQNTDNRYLDAALTFKYDFTFIKGLSAKAFFSSNSSYSYMKNFDKEFFFYDYDRTNDIYTVVGVAQNSKTQLDEQLTRSVNFTTQVNLNYIKSIGDHYLNALIVGEFIQNDGNYFSAHREGYLTTTIDQLFAGGSQGKNNNGTQNQDGRVGYAGRFNYSYAGKYLAEVSMRYDGSARYIEDRRWGFFPSASLGWRLSEEEFLKNVSSLDNLKIRASVGKAGNDYVAQYNYLTGYVFNGNNVFGETIDQGLVSKGLSNADLTWENTITYNLGLDGSLWKKLLSFEFDVFYRKVTNVAGYRSTSVPYTFGAALPQENINSYDNRGFELVLKHEKMLKDFRYTIEGNITYARSKWIHYDEPVYPDEETRARLQKSGQWTNRYFGYSAVGLFQSQDEIDAWPTIQDNNDNNTLKPGDIKYTDYNKDGKLDFKDNHEIGRGFTPDVMFGLNLGFQYKGFDFLMLWQGATGFNALFLKTLSKPFNNSNVPYAIQSDYWTPENTGAKYPRLAYNGAPNNTYASTYWLENATYFRLKNIQVGYSIPNSICEKLHIKSLRFYFAGYNILTFDNVSLFDPESGQGTGGNSDGQFYPQQKSVNAGINLIF
jgi:TonB-linked SusC/RagA family outer membrane protein